MSLGIIFSGQGAQKSKMGLDFYEDPLFAELLNHASNISGLNMLKILENKNNELTETVNLQPTLTTLNYGIYRMLKRDIFDMKVSCMAGLSLGEYSALIASNALTFEQGIQLLVDRGKYMQEASNSNAGKMLALIKPKLKEITQICALCKVEIANYNSPKQIVIGGQNLQIEFAKKMIMERKAALRIIELEVSGAFHTSLFSNVQKQLEKRLKDVKFENPQIPVVSNTTVEEFQKESLTAVLSKQVANPTYFEKDIKLMKNTYGLTHIVQIGPGKALSNFVKQMSLGIKTYNISNIKDYRKFLNSYRDINLKGKKNGF
ncbi:ACP S-malonyltransferase [Limosilactobacillus reuteri]|uniref:ACP S-malonyltransferase n=1 Tax=Limosilactobacillus reuteri TaxID=1598 RepID=UPI001E477D67|nr:ACP S-malonyltransferase [Limosilactobacillus reuteri]UFK69242.1 Polyketide biosynthesis malonyl CoA-acyl carrier protein transacylase BaeC [Limosilactobacillus reuteri]